jgi:phosphoribosylamine--glycine ligase
VICDGNNFIPLGFAHDHKRVGDNDVGANTGGMGTYSPSPFINQEMEDKTEVYKKEITKLQNSCSVYKTQYSKLESKYLDICKKHQIEEHATIYKL